MRCRGEARAAADQPAAMEEPEVSWWDGCGRGWLDGTGAPYARRGVRLHLSGLSDRRSGWASGGDHDRRVGRSAAYRRHCEPGGGTTHPLPTGKPVVERIGATLGVVGLTYELRRPAEPDKTAPRLRHAMLL